MISSREEMTDMEDNMNFSVERLEWTRAPKEYSLQEN